MTWPIPQMVERWSQEFCSGTDAGPMGRRSLAKSSVDGFLGIFWPVTTLLLGMVLNSIIQKMQK